MKTYSSICVGMSFFNDEDYLDSAIKSVVNQTFKDWRLLLINDGSTDNSLEIAKKYVNDERVTLLSDGENKGLVKRLNELIDISNCKYFARMDADDIMHLERLEKQFDYLQKHPNVDLVGCWAYSIDVNNKIEGLLQNEVHPKTVKSVLNHKCFIHPTVLGRREWFLKHHYDSSFLRVEDMELWCRTINSSSFYNIPEPYYYYREVGIPYLQKYMNSMRGERAVIRKYYGHRPLLKEYFMFKTYFKQAVYRIFSLLSLEDTLIQRRSSKLESSLIDKATNALLKSIGI